MVVAYVAILVGQLGSLNETGISSYLLVQHRKKVAPSAAIPLENEVAHKLGLKCLFQIGISLEFNK